MNSTFPPARWPAHFTPEEQGLMDVVKAYFAASELGRHLPGETLTEHHEDDLKQMMLDVAVSQHVRELEDDEARRKFLGLNRHTYYTLKADLYPQTIKE